jgi:ParB family transcriptional regulator, chromosome partitioning protein
MAKPKQTSSIEQIPTADLIPYARNARTHSEAQVAQIAGSIQEFGFCNPVLIDADNGIIAGHGRVLAAQRLKLESVPCLRLSHLTDAQKRAYVLADNRIALSSGWDDEMLANELSDLHADEFDMALLGFDVDELGKLLSFEAEEIEPPVLADGDREPFQQMAFMLHDEQAEIVKRAIEQAKSEGPFESINENSNGNALARIAEAYCG